MKDYTIMMTDYSMFLTSLAFARDEDYLAFFFFNIMFQKFFQINCAQKTYTLTVFLSATGKLNFFASFRTSVFFKFPTEIKYVSAVLVLKSKENNFDLWKSQRLSQDKKMCFLRHSQPKLGQPCSR